MTVRGVRLLPCSVSAFVLLVLGCHTATRTLFFKKFYHYLTEKESPSRQGGR